MVKYIHYAHLNDTSVKEGDVIDAGHIIGHLGKSGTGYAHLHFECHANNPAERGWSAYSRGLSKENVAALYPNPYEFLNGKVWPADGTYMKQDAYDYLEWNGSEYHPGIDLNKGAGNDDLGIPVRCVSYARVVKILYNDGAWGNHIYLELLTKEDMSEYVKKNDTVVLQRGGKNDGALYKVNHGEKKKYELTGGDAGLVACAVIAGKVMSEDELKQYTNVQALKEVS